jgi:hypothetical protein
VTGDQSEAPTVVLPILPGVQLAAPTVILAGPRQVWSRGEIAVAVLLTVVMLAVLSPVAVHIGMIAARRP